MIERFFLKDFLSFSHVELEFSPGLIIFSGPSGSGKSILLESILSSFGLASCDAKICESSVTWHIDESYGIENEEINIFKQLKKEKTRYFINAQSVAKKTIANIASKHLKHLALRDYSDFENKNLLEIIDQKIATKNFSIITLKHYVKDSYEKYIKLSKELEKIEQEEKKIVELKEFTSYEIEKIESLNPKIGEYEELFSIKKELSKKEKVIEAIQKASMIFDLESHVYEALELTEKESTFFDDAMNELRSHFETAQEHFDALEDVDVEDVLNRLEQLSDLKRKYGSVAEALEYLEQKKQELYKYEHIEFEKKELQEKLEEESKKLKKYVTELSKLRTTFLKNFEHSLQMYASDLYLGDIHVTLSQGELTSDGVDTVMITLRETPLEKISTGEFNRLRLAVLALKSEFLSQDGHGVLMLDEIDANLSGEESMSVAKVLRLLAKKFQIFVISHQPQLTSQGEQHFLVYKDKKGNSLVKELNHQERIDEIARIISGDSVSQEAKQFAKELLNS
jgi:DNA repair protein RecN (Recombination protein N)